MLGTAVAERFESAAWTVHRAGRRPDSREGFRQLDLDLPESLPSALSGLDLVISSVPDPSFAAERVILERGGVLINCSHAPARSAASITAAGEPQGTVLLNAGLVPGLSNLMASELLEKYPEADCIEVAFTLDGSATAGRAAGEFVHHALTSRHHHRAIRLPMPEPFGELACIEVAEGEDGGFAGSPGGRKVETYFGFRPRPLSIALRATNALRLMSVLPRVAFAVDRGDAAEPSREPTVVWVGVRLGAQRLGASVLSCEGDYFTTAAAAQAFAELLLAGGTHRPGCFNPEDLFSLSDLLPALDPIGVRVKRDWGSGGE